MDKIKLTLIIVLLCLIGVGVLIFGTFAHSPLKGVFQEDNAVAISYMHDVGEGIKNSILSTTIQGLQKTRLLAQSPEFEKARK